MPFLTSVVFSDWFKVINKIKVDVSSIGNNLDTRWAEQIALETGDGDGGVVEVTR